ncbi:hypothetical protein [Pontibacter sp. G13]|uniref:hypothetical protein n=1 Tax=Pontibacter sp. G13 TaxID=3074898 RepID=UPI00288AC205|nr:hypothetical protein [Pontibacter sp. G13]WNJ19110.1 hypothetical protein RJD25_01350 [Pontibacter sp. G13]
MTTTLPRQLLVCSLMVLTLCSSVLATPETQSSSINGDSLKYVTAQQIRYMAPDSSLKLLKESHDGFMQCGDTASAVNVLFVAANVEGNLANYKDAYDHLWRGLLLADKAGLDREKALLYIEIGRHYSFFKRRNKALEYFKISLNINKELVAAGKMDPSGLVSSYFAMTSTYRELDEFAMARTFLDSSMVFMNPITQPTYKAYLTFELACIQTAEGEYEEALKSFELIRHWFEASDPSYLVLFYTYLSDALVGLNRLGEAEKRYKQALDIAREYHMHIDFTPLIHQKLSNLYLLRGDYAGAYQELKLMKELDERFFDSRSENNRSLLEIEDAFRQEKKAQMELIRQQKLEQLEHEEDVWFLQRVILLVSITSIVMVGFLYFSYIRAKFRADKQMLKRQQEMELQKANEVLEIKNKELAASALKLIEKDEDLSLLKSKIQHVDGGGNVDVRELKQVLRSISISNDRNWEEFETRFVAVNESFYHRLQEKFPKLTQRDLKLCALIKLNFSSKEMAKLLGISVESAHTSRYRLRKKLDLTREQNLTEFIANI